MYGFQPAYLIMEMDLTHVQQVDKELRQINEQLSQIDWNFMIPILIKMSLKPKSLILVISFTALFMLPEMEHI